MKIFKRILFFLLLLLTSCNSDKVTDPLTNDSSSAGTLFVTVKSYYNGSPIKGAEVIIKETGNKDTTDAYGQITFKNIAKGTYSIIAHIRGVGSGKSIVQVTPAEINRLDVTFYQGIFTEPTIRILSPSSYIKYTPSDTVLIKATVTDVETPSDSIKVDILNDNQKLISLNPDKNGKVEYKTTNLPKGVQKIYIKATNKTGYYGIDSAVVYNILPPKANLSGSSNNQGFISLKWTMPDEPDFIKYEVYRSEIQDFSSSGKLIATISNKNTTTFVDSFPTLSSYIYYQILTYNKEGEKSTSNTLGLVEPNGKIYQFKLKDVLIHPTKPWLYLLDISGTIHIYDYETRTMKIEKAVTTGANYMEIGDNGYGMELYVPQNDGWIKILDDQTLAQKAQISCGAAVNSVVIDGKGHVFASISAWTNKPLRSYDRTTLNSISANGDFELCRLKMLPSNNEIIEISTTVSPTDMDYYKFDDKGVFTIHKDDLQHGDHSLNPYIFRVSPSGAFVVTASDGSMYKADQTMTYLGTIPHGSSAYADYAFDDSGSLIYAGCSNEKKIRIFNYPSFLEVPTILTKGYPFYIFRRDSKIISISKTTYSDWWNDSYSFALEVIDLK